MVLVKAGDKAVLSCETDSLPEPAVTWHKDGQPLVLAQRTQALLGGQRLEIQDTQVRCLVVRAAVGSPGNVASWSWGAEGGRGEQLGGKMGGLLPPWPAGPQSKVISSVRGGRRGKSTGPQIRLHTDSQNHLEQIRLPVAPESRILCRPLWL